MLPNVLIEDLCYNLVKAGKTIVMTRCLCEKLWARTKGRKGVVDGKQYIKPRVGPTRSVFLEKSVGGSHAISFPPFFQHFCREGRIGVLSMSAPLSSFLKIANQTGF